MNQDSLTRDAIVRLLGQETTLSEFRQWLRPVNWRLADEATRSANPLTRKVALYVAEFNQGHRTEDNLRELLAEATTTAYAEVTEALNFRLLDAVAQTIRENVRDEVRISRVPGYVTTGSLSPRIERRTTKDPTGLVGSR